MTQRRPLIAGNWKMHGTRAEAERLLSALRAALDGVSGREVVIAPPFTVLETAARVLAGSSLRWAGQDCHWEAQGAFTGEVSAPMLKDLGCSYVIVGHSERRQYFGETDDTVRRKVVAAQAAGLCPIVCVGETLAERERGETLSTVARQVRAVLGDQQDAATVREMVIAYEPVWAIGTGRTASPDQAQEVHGAIRRLVAERFGEQTAGAVRVLYGGSVKAESTAGLMAQPDIDGALVGGASLQAAAFASIVSLA